MPNEICVVFHNRSNYDNHVIIKELANKFQGTMWMSWERNRKVQNFFLFDREDVVKVDKAGNENIITISDKIKFIDSAIFMVSSISNFVDNLEEGMHKIKCKDYDCFRKYESVKENSIKYRCLSCNKDYLKKIDEELKKHLILIKNTFKGTLMQIWKSANIFVFIWK